MLSVQRLTGPLVSGGGLIVGFLTGRWIAGRLRFTRTAKVMPAEAGRELSV